MASYVWWAWSANRQLRAAAEFLANAGMVVHRTAVQIDRSIFRGGRDDGSASAHRRLLRVRVSAYLRVVGKARKDVPGAAVGADLRAAAYAKRHISVLGVKARETRLKLSVVVDDGAVHAARLNLM